MKKTGLFILAAAMSLAMAACGAQSASAEKNAGTQNAELPAATDTEQEENADTDGSVQSAGIPEQAQSREQEEAQSGESSAAVQAGTARGSVPETADLFTERDLEQNPDLSGAVYETLKDGEDIIITGEGVYVISGKAEEASIIVEAQDTDKVQIVLDGVTVTNTDAPCIYVKQADKVFVTTTDSDNTLSVTGTFAADGDTNTDAVIFSRDDLVLNGTGTLTVSSTDNGITGKDDLKITGGTLNISCAGDALEANDSIAVADGTIQITTQKDGLHAENDEDDTAGYIYLGGGTLEIAAGDDGIHATTYLQIDGGNLSVDAAECLEATVIQINEGTLNLSASDDGINAAQKSDVSTPIVEINGGSITIAMGAGDTDAVDSNGNIVINGGTLDITAQSPFDYDGTAEYNGGTIIVNGQEVDSISNQFGGMGGGPGMQGGGPGGMPDGGMGGGPGGMPGGGMPGGGI